ncbi:Uncharacterised protein [Yersinia nurmii]|uniref:Uncharacterized protein n=1 Tax=Yersinia nurmii TaxID=685706 RepID=A0ABM9S4P4_9GAMM|nr:Uncharacterised protein [Yersinia nurmii]
MHEGSSKKPAFAPSPCAGQPCSEASTTSEEQLSRQAFKTHLKLSDHLIAIADEKLQNSPSLLLGYKPKITPTPCLITDLSP